MIVSAHSIFNRARLGSLRATEAGEQVTYPCDIIGI